MLASEEAIGLCSHNEIAFCQSVDFMGPEGNFGLSPAEQNVRVMSLLLG
jgi:hypothetical protein